MKREEGLYEFAETRCRVRRDHEFEDRGQGPVKMITKSRARGAAVERADSRLERADQVCTEQHMSTPAARPLRDEDANASLVDTHQKRPPCTVEGFVLPARERDYSIINHYYLV